MDGDFGRRRFWLRPDVVFDDDEYAEVLVEAAGAIGTEWTVTAAGTGRASVDGRERIRVEATCAPANFAGDMRYLPDAAP